ncbi:hypothetical protein [Pontimicrobium sp. MEBiC01747]
MKEIIPVLCLTFLALIIIYWIMPTKKMKAVNEAIKSLLQVLPITKIIEGITKTTISKGK